MTASVALINGGQSGARRIFEREGRGDWSQALPLVLEKLGYLDFEVAGPDALEDPHYWNVPAALLVARLPPENWTPRALELAASGRTCAFLELPPVQLRGLLGITAATAAGRSGVVEAVDDSLRSAIGRTTSLSQTRVEPPRTRPVDRDPDQDWQRLPVPITPEQAGRWRARSWDVESWRVEAGTSVLARWVAGEPQGESWPAVIARGRLWAACFSMLAYLGEQMTVEPFSSAEHLNWARSTVIEALLSELLDEMHRRAGRRRARVLPWPADATWVLNVRHDYDRALTSQSLDEMLRAHRAGGTSATWYWRARHVGGADGDALARRVDRTTGHEVAHHTEQLWGAAGQEQAQIERALGRTVSGTSAHGDRNCFRWQGAPNVLWAEQRGLDYTEFISHSHLHPHRFAALTSDGAIEPARVICLPHHVSLDRDTSAGGAASQEVIAAAAEYVRGRGLLQVMSHPDLNREELFETLSSLPDESRLNWTARGISDWWRRSHVRGELEVSHGPDASVIVASARGVRGLVLEVLEPDGRRTRHIVDLDPGRSIALRAPGAAPAKADRLRDALWRQKAVPIFGDIVRAYYATQGIDPAAQSVKTTIATNTELVPSRVETVLRRLREMQGVETLRGKRILDVGGGFGAFALFLAMHPDAPRVTTIDIRGDFVDSAREAAARLGVVNLDSVLADVRSLEPFPDECFDVVVLNNSFIYLPTAADMRAAIAQIFRVLRPGGVAIMYHANRWRTREPFTGAPIVHLLPSRLADLAQKVVGWQHNHGRVKLVSVIWLGRELRRAGLRDVHATGAFARFYAISGRRPISRV